jgi:hypothetical protein
MANADQYDYLLKLLLIGDSGVGKSSLLLRYVAHDGWRKVAILCSDVTLYSIPNCVLDLTLHLLSCCGLLCRRQLL